MKKLILMEGELRNISPLSFIFKNNHIISAIFADYSSISSNSERKYQKLPIDKKIEGWLKYYENGDPKPFPFPVNISGTSFQKKVWKEIKKIGFGERVTYQSIADKIGKKNACRAVGNACGSNPVPLIIPCHRVVASNGIGGFSSRIEIKKALLGLEIDKKH